MKKSKKQVKNNIILSLNNSSLLAGIAMITLNLGSKYVEMGFSKNQENAFKSIITREILIFAMVFTATKNIFLAIILTASFMVLSSFLLNDQSKFCIIPGYFKKIQDLIDVNQDNIISKEEEQRAIEILKRAQYQKKKPNNIYY